MAECKMQVNVRMDVRLVKAIDEEASKDSVTRTDIISRIISGHFGPSLPGVCNHCGKWNEVESNYCSNCGQEMKT